MEKYYDINELSKATNISPQKIIYLTSLAFIEPSYTVDGNKFYSESDKNKLEYINTYEDLGYSLDEISSVEQQDLDMDNLDNRIETLETMRSLIDMKLEELQQQRVKRKTNVKRLVKTYKPNDRIAC